MKNKIYIIGHVGKTPDVVEFEHNNTLKASFTVATTEKHKKKNGEEVSNTEWHKVECWAKLAEIVEECLKKGSLVYVEGKQKHDQYEKGGVKKTHSFIQATEIKILTPKNQ